MIELIQDLSRRTNLSIEAIQILWTSLHAGHGRAAQFNHPELGGMGQWMPGMIMIGDMNNHTLKAAITTVCTELAGCVNTPSDMPPPLIPGTAWWDSGLGSPSSSASQHDFAYAYFPAYHCLAVKSGAKIVYYNTQSLRVIGISVQDQHLYIETDHGRKTLADLSVMTT